VREYKQEDKIMKCPVCGKEFGYYSFRRKAWVCRHCGNKTPVKDKKK